jgi:hypothetical protein
MLRTPRTASLGCWPDGRQRLLLGATFWEGERARAAWNGWRSAVPREQVTFADARLLACAYRPLCRLGVDDPMLSLAGGVYRRTWYLNQLALRRGARAVAQLRAADIDVLVLKGAASAILHYGDVGARPMDDVDLLVDPRRLAAAIHALGASGWLELASQGPVAGPLRYGSHVEDADGNEIDIHAYALMQSADDADLWESCVPLDLMGVETRAPGPPEQLLLVCTHGLRWDVSTIRWAADAMAILRCTGSAFDWERLVQRTQARRLTVTVGHALAWLRESLDADVPEWVLRRLRAGPRLRFERANHTISMRPPTPLGFAAMSFDRYRRFASLAPAGERPASFARFLQSAWEIDGSVRLLVHGGRKLARRAL